MDVIVTDVTKMGHDWVCVAGWCVEETRMIRPVLSPGTFWEARHATSQLFQLGNVVRLASKQPRQPWRGLPHSREDIVVETLPTLVKQVPVDELPVALKPSASPTVEAIFGGHLQEGKYVDDGVDCDSLGAIDLQVDGIEFVEDSNYVNQKVLRGRILDGSRSGLFGSIPYNFKVVSKSLTDIWDQSGLVGIQALRGKATRAHVRIGLAGPFPQQQNRCYAMVNNVLFY